MKRVRERERTRESKIEGGSCNCSFFNCSSSRLSGAVSGLHNTRIGMFETGRRASGSRQNGMLQHFLYIRQKLF